MEAAYLGAANGVAGDGNGGALQVAAPAIREQDRLMPIANVIRIMRRVLPAHAKISDDAKETIQECVSEYISFITGEANERCQREQRKTITAEDVLWAMSRLGFDDYVEPLSIYLHRYREFEGEARGVGVGAARGDVHHAHGHGHGHGHGMLKSRAPVSMVPHHDMLKSRAPVSMVPHHDMHIHAAMYGGSVPPPQHHHHAFQLMPPHGPHHGQHAHQYDVYGGEHGMTAYYGGAYAPGNGGGHGDGSGSSGSAGTSATQTINFDAFGYK